MEDNNMIENLNSHIQIHLKSFKVSLNMIILTSSSNMDGTFLNGHEITLWKAIWRCTIVWCERFLPAECPSEWAHLALEPDEYFYPHWGWDECWAAPALQCANESHLTGCPMTREAAPQRKSSYLRTNWKKTLLKYKVFTETIWNLLYNLLLLSSHQVPDMHRCTISWYRIRVVYEWPGF